LLLLGRSPEGAPLVLGGYLPHATEVTPWSIGRAGPADPL